MANPFDSNTLRAEKMAEWQRAASRGEPFAALLDLGVAIDVGAPLPHVLTSGWRTALVFHRGLDDPAWDGTYTTVVDPAAETVHRLGVVFFDQVVATLLGPPNDEAIEGHPLWGSGLEPYRAHIVENSAWIADYERRNRVHPHHSAETWNALTHYLFAFHDETFECLARGHEVRAVDSTFKTVIHSLIDEMMDR